MALTAAIMMSLGAANNAIGGYYGARSQQSALRAQANIDETNARISETGAQAELLKGQHEESAVRLRTAQLKSSQRAAMAANGVDIGAGSAVEALTSSDVMGEADAATVKQNAIRSAWGYRMQAVNSTNDAILKRAAADSINPSMVAASSLLGGAGAVAGSWYQYKKS